MCIALSSGMEDFLGGCVLALKIDCAVRAMRRSKELFASHHLGELVVNFVYFLQEEYEHHA